MKKKTQKLVVSILAGFLAAIMILSLILSILPVRAAASKSSSEIQEQIDALEEEQAKLQEEMDKLQSQMDENLSATADVVAEKSNIDQQISLLMSKISMINEQVDAYNVLIADKQEELDAAQAKLAYLNEKNKERIRAMEEEGSLSYWSVLFKANSFSDFLDRLNMVEEIAASDRRRIKEMSDAAAEVAEAKQTLFDKKVDLESTKTELDAAREELDEKRAESDEILAKLVEEAQRLDNDMFDYHQKTEELLAELGQAQIDLEDAKYQEWLATSQTTRPSYSGGSDGDYGPPPTSGDWVIPCNYVLFTSAYGWREPPAEGASTFHGGVDLAGPEGTPIYATRSGYVYRNGYTEYNGYYVGIDHGDGFASAYLHLTHYIVSVGEYVSQGQVIGYMGSTGISTGPHLHFTIYYNGNTVNPAEYIDFY